MRCPDLATILAWLDGELPPREFEVVEKLILTDPEARRLAFELHTENRLLEEALAPEVDGQEFAAGVLRIIRERAGDDAG